MSAAFQLLLGFLIGLPLGILLRRGWGHVHHHDRGVTDLELKNFQLAQAIHLTQEYCGDDLLPPHPGWSWWEALVGTPFEREAKPYETEDEWRARTSRSQIPFDQDRP